MNMSYKNYLNITLLVIMLASQTKVLQAQQQQMENTMSQYFRNRMLWNPAYTGVDGNKAYVLQNRSWVGFEGAPLITGISGEMNFGKNSSGGVEIISDATGILYRTYGVLNYGYRVKFSEHAALRLGVALAINGDRLNNKYIDGGAMADPLIAANINSKPQFDGNLGAVLQLNKLDIGVSFFSLGKSLRNEKFEANHPTSQVGLSFPIELDKSEKLKLKTIFMMRTYEAIDMVIDGGVQFSYNDLFHVMGVYQSAGNIRSGAGIRKSGLGELNFFYNTNIKIANISSQQYELGLGVYFK